MSEDFQQAFDQAEKLRGKQRHDYIQGLALESPDLAERVIRQLDETALSHLLSLSHTDRTKHIASLADVDERGAKRLRGLLEDHLCGEAASLDGPQRSTFLTQETGGDGDFLRRVQAKLEEHWFNQALDLEGTERDAFLNKLRDEEPETAARIDGMLEEFEDMDDLFENSLVPEGMLSHFSKTNTDAGESDLGPATWSEDSDDDDRPTLSPDQREVGDEYIPTQIGPYTVLRKIGEGGMGQVYLVRQPMPRRDLAMKLLSSTRTSPEFRARFEAEYRVLAMMKHHHIAHIHEVGTSDRGDLYFTMEYVEGLSITQYCRKKRLSLRERLLLFRQVCEGVEHAHQKAVVHRDLKPSNILVTEADGKPVVKLIDFGIAKGLDDDYQLRHYETRVGTLVGTLEYMSHEQLLGADSDTRSDIYSLGVVLYEMLSGSIPLDATTLNKPSTEELLRFFRESRPKPPSVRLLKSDNTRLAIESAGFPEGMGLLPHLKGELDWVVGKALEKSLSQRYGTVADLKRDIDAFLDGHPVSARPPGLWYTTAKFIQRNKLPVLSLSLVLMSLIVGLYFSVSANIRVSRSKIRLQATNRFLQDMLSAPDPRKVGLDAKVIDVLRNAEEDLQRDFTDDSDYDMAEVEASIRQTLGNTFFGLSQYQEAIDHLQRAYDLKRAHLGKDNPEVLRTRYFLARALRRTKRWEEAIAHYNETISIQKQVLGPEHRHTLQSQAGLAALFLVHRDYRTAIELYKDVLETQQRVFGMEDRDTAKTLNGLGTAFCFMGVDNLKNLRTAYRIQKKIMGDLHPETLSTLSNLSYCLCEQSYFEEGIEMSEQSVYARENAYGKAHDTYFSSALNLIECYRRGAHFKQALELGVNLFDYRASNQGQDTRFFQILLVVARLKGYLGESAQAEALLQDMILHFGESELKYAEWDVTFNLLGANYLMQRQFDDAEWAFHFAMEQCKTQFGEDGWRILKIEGNLLTLREVQGDYDEASLLRCQLQSRAVNTPEIKWQLYVDRLILLSVLGEQNLFEETLPDFIALSEELQISDVAHKTVSFMTEHTP